VIWAVGIVAYTAMIQAVFPSLRGQTNLTDVMKNYPKPLLVMFGIDSENFDLGSATSFVNVYLYSAIIPMLVVVLCVLFGADTLAGEEDRNLLDLVLSYPVRRRSVVLQKALVLVIEAAAVGAALFLTVWIGGLAVDLRPPLGNLAGATVGLVALGVVFGGVALAVGAATGSKAAASGAAAAVAVATYLIWSMAKLVSWLEPLRWLGVAAPGHVACRLVAVRRYKRQRGRKYPDDLGDVESLRRGCARALRGARSRNSR
jgi:ABC-2 type transport system permease protein